MLHTPRPRMEETRDGLNHVHAPHLSPAQATPSIHSSEMASFVPLCFFLHLLVLPAARSSSYPAIFGFGNSLTDTGNLVFFSGGTEAASGLPYGETYFGHPSGRFSDGRLVIDFIAQALRLPLVPPYLAGNSSEDFKHGANFAVAGACALGNAFFEAEGLNVTWQDYSLSTQFKWFEQLLQRSTSSLHYPKDVLNSSLILMGEIGGNDYNQPFFQGIKLDEIRPFVPSVISAISSGINDLIELGAKTLLVPGNFPIGCVPVYLDIYKSYNVEEYESDTGCIKWLNELSKYHNRLLLAELDRLRKLHPNVMIIYANYYDAMISFFRAPEVFGFKAPLHACCGSDGPYSVNRNAPCGHRNAKVCSDPSSSVSWDGIHLTEAAYGTIASSLLEGPHANPPLTRACSSTRQNAVDDF
ncbi:unnamed protein product [Musa acuminata subsp. malaccensis]|uniref:(wild Malaysian banana) hypothetical protein n=1 Tax=Musa acuminata subsp. malaccensis TaxID=214687 RepID=A0A8D6ZKH2_MUSAM|nr:unnamed protein product [Musa acuminata subsp. malaccensis]